MSLSYGGKVGDRHPRLMAASRSDWSRERPFSRWRQ